ncbi:MAG: hypothetical protein AB7E55_28350 [Pigmentiphaga sp.]
MKYGQHPVVVRIMERFRELGMPNVFWTGDMLVASMTDECQAKSKPDNVCIALHFNFDGADEEYAESLQIVALESDVQGAGGGLVRIVVEALDEGMTVCVYDSTDGESRGFWPEMATRYPSLVIY